MTRASHPSNIDSGGCRRRWRLGTVAAICAIVVLAWLDRSGATRLWRLAIFPPAWIAALGFLQAHESTCVALAARGACEVGGAIRPLDDAGHAAELKARGRSILLRATLAAAALSLLAVAWP